MASDLYAAVWPLGRAVHAEGEPAPGTVVCTGTLQEIQDFFHLRGWTDGLPIVPPTHAEVERFLSRTPRTPETVLGVLPHEYREASVRAIAVNGVMAGCRPEYMPILVAIVETMVDPEWMIENASSTSSPEPLAIVSGSIVGELGFNTETGAMRVGWQPNASVGRFVRLFMRNVGGFRPPLDMGSIGAGFNVALAENEEAVVRLGWPPYRVDQGHGMDESTVTVQSVLATSPPVYSGGTSPEELMEPLVYFMSTTCGPWSFLGAWHGRWHPLLVITPAVAAAFAGHGWDKDDIRRHLHEHASVEASWLERYPAHVAAQSIPLAQLHAEGRVDERYVRSADGARRVPVLLRPEWTSIVVAGDPGRNQSRIYVNSGSTQPPLTRSIEARAG